MPMTVGWKQRILQKNREWAGQGMRVIAMAYRKLEMPSDKNLERNPFSLQKRSYSSGAASLTNEDVSHLVWIGMAAMMDPPRPEARAAVQTAKRAGIRPVMITGDHRITAQSIARRIGIFCEGDEAVTGMELDAMTDAELVRRLDRISVYARVSPAHKIRIVEAWQNRGHIVAMTGDGVNDAPALKKADIGVAMGQSGTEVSRDAASMILTDDNFATIIKAVSNGRNVYRNICHAIEFLLSGNIAGILCVLYTSFMALPMPFAPVHLLFINLLTDSLPAIAIGMEPQEEGLLDQPPRDPNEDILTGPFLKAVTGQGILIAVCTMLAYHIGFTGGEISVASTMAFSTLTLARLFHGFNCRSERPVLWLGLLTNLWTVMAFETGAVLLAAVLFLPGLQQMFSVADLNRYQFLAVATLAFLPTVVIQLGKIVREVVK
jgi:Ca2+-transporting ATPase